MGDARAYAIIGTLEQMKRDLSTKPDSAPAMSNNYQNQNIPELRSISDVLNNINITLLFK